MLYSSWVDNNFKYQCKSVLKPVVAAFFTNRVNCDCKTSCMDSFYAAVANAKTAAQACPYVTNWFNTRI